MDARRLRWSRFIGSLLRPGAALVAALTAIALVACEEPDIDPDSTVATGGTVEATPSPTATPTLEPKPEAAPPQKYERYPMVPAGPIAAEPVRVYTGDGDCLNVRPSPGTQFQSDPRTCVPEGFLLWLYGPALEVDGLQWRYALGEGWVAAQYVRAAPEAALLFDGELPPVIVSTTDGVETYVSRIENRSPVPGSSAVIPLASTELVAPQLGGSGFLEVAPGGEWAAGTSWNSWPVATLLNLVSGAEEQHPGHAFTGWSPDGKALLVAFPNCPSNCWAEKLAYVEPGGQPVEFATMPSGSWGFQWTPGGESVVVRAEGSSLYEFFLTGDYRILIYPDKLPLDLGEISISPDGRQLLSSPFLGAIQVIDLESGAARTFERAPQVTDFGGRCGGASGKLAVWLDDQTFAWHESYAQKGHNGITIGSLATGQRTLIPFFTIQDIRRVTDTWISFTTYEYLEGAGQSTGFPLTWLLDIETGEARPITVGSAPAWQVDGASSPNVSPFGGV